MLKIAPATTNHKRAHLDQIQPPSLKNTTSTNVETLPDPRAIKQKSLSPESSKEICPARRRVSSVSAQPGQLILFQVDKVGVNAEKMSSSSPSKRPLHQHITDITVPELIGNSSQEWQDPEYVGLFLITDPTRLSQETRLAPPNPVANALNPRKTNPTSSP
jgi:hypothetical protein